MRLVLRDLEVRSRLTGTRRAHVYACATYHRRGPSVCENRLVAHLPTVDSAVLDGLQKLLDPAMLHDAARVAIDEICSPRQDLEPHRDAISAELTRIDVELARLAAAVASGGSLPSLVAAISERERRRAALQTELARLAPSRGVSDLDRRRIFRELEGILHDTRQLLASQVGPARQVLRQIFPGRLVFTPHRGDTGVCYVFKGQAAVGRLFEGVSLPQAVVSPRGFVGW